jgi:hypothetical protein
MATEKDGMRLRPHHIACIRFWDKTFPERGDEFLKVEDNIKQAVNTGAPDLITVSEGTDELCRVCPLNADGRCASPLGDETEVRKWDAILLKELELPYDTRLTAAEWRRLIDARIPFRLCRKCQWRKNCRAGQLTLES